MANDINKIIMVARLTRDAELRYTPSGAAVASFDVANNYSYKSGDERKESVNYFSCVVWGKLAEIIAEYGKKGTQIALEGRLSQRLWTDNDGNNKSKIEIVVEKFQFIGGKKSDSNETAPGGKPDNSMGTPADNVPPFDEHNAFSDDDIPF